MPITKKYQICVVQEILFTKLPSGNIRIALKDYRSDFGTVVDQMILEITPDKNYNWDTFYEMWLGIREDKILSLSILEDYINKQDPLNGVRLLLSPSTT